MEPRTNIRGFTLFFVFHDMWNQVEPVEPQRTGRIRDLPHNFIHELYYLSSACGRSKAHVGVSGTTTLG